MHFLLCSGRISPRRSPGVGAGDSAGVLPLDLKKIYRRAGSGLKHSDIAKTVLADSIS